MRELRILFAPETFNLGETSRAVEVARVLKVQGHRVHFMGYSSRFAEYVRQAGFTLDLLEPELDDRAAGVSLIYVRPHPMSRGHLAGMTEFPLTAGRTRLGKMGNRLAGRVVRSVLPRISWTPGPFRQVAGEHGVALPSRTVELLHADLDLIASLFPFPEDRSTVPGEVHVGPVYALPEGELPEQVEALGSSGRPVVHVGLGSSAGRWLARDVLGQVAELDVDIVSGAGRYLDEDDRAGLPGNVHLFDFLPAHRLGGLLDASVIHGGEGTVQTACAAGVPFAGIGLQAEQRFNIEACVRHGNALRFTAGDLARHRLPGIVARLLQVESLRTAAGDLAARARPVGAGNAAREIVSFLTGEGHRGQSSLPAATD